jgi:hypothetical protein
MRGTYRAYRERWASLVVARPGLATTVGGATGALGAVMGTEIGGALTSEALASALVGGGVAAVVGFIVGAIGQRLRANRRLAAAADDPPWPRTQ